MSALNLIVDKVKGYEFTGHVKLDDLDSSMLDRLGIDRENHLSDEIEITGEFDCKSNIDGELYVSNLHYVNIIGLNERIVELEESHYDIADLLAQIESNGGEYQAWHDNNY